MIKINNFLLPQELEKVSSFARSKMAPGNTFRINLTEWVPSIVKDSNPVLIYDIDDEQIIDIINNACQKTFDKIPKKVMLYYWTVGSYIPWHCDSHVSNAGTFYLNENWDRNWGGLFLYEDGEEIKAIVPECNCFLYQNKTMLHATTPTTSSAPPRVSFQMFFE